MALTGGGQEAHNQALYEQLAELGWVGVAIPEQYGGADGSLVDQCIFFEEIFRGMAPIYGAGSSSTVAGCYKRFGNERQREEVLAKLAEGKVMAIAISEPEAGSDVGNISCRAQREGDEYVLNGQKTWCSAAHIAERILVIARTSREESPHAGLTMIEVATDLDGVETRPIETMGGREVNDVFLTDVRVGAERVVGEVGGAWRQVMAGLDGERLICAAQGLGMAERALEDLLVYVKQRKQFGRPIGTFQALRHRRSSAPGCSSMTSPAGSTRGAATAPS